MAQDIGIINEIGDMGLGFRELTEPDAKKYQEATQKQETPNTVVVNEEKK